MYEVGGYVQHMHLYVSKYNIYSVLRFMFYNDDDVTC